MFSLKHITKIIKLKVSSKDLPSLINISFAYAPQPVIERFFLSLVQLCVCPSKKCKHACFETSDFFVSSK